MQMKNIKVGAVVKLLPGPKNYQHNPDYWTKATVLAVREPILGLRYEPKGVRVRVHQRDGRWGKWASPDVSWGRDRPKGWTGSEMTVSREDRARVCERLPKDEYIIPARVVGSPWDDEAVEAYWTHQRETRERRQAREMQEQTRRARVIELRDALGLAELFRVPSLSTHTTVYYEPLIPVLEELQRLREG